MCLVLNQSNARLSPVAVSISYSIFNERELTFTFAIMLTPVRLSSLSSVTLVHPTQAVVIFRNISTALGTLAIR